MSLEDFEKATTRVGGGVKVKLQDGESIKGVFVGEPKIFYNVFDENKQYSKPVNGADERFRWNFAVQNASGWSVKIWEGSMAFGKILWTQIKEFGQNTLFKVVRTGTGKQTRYTVLYVKDQPDMSSLKSLELFDLGKYLEDPEQANVIKQVESVFNQPEEIPYQGDPFPTDEDAPVQSEEIPF